ncbi:MAG: Gfo/Idh/MocA family oxidoreductase [Nibricoccus sp.]
MSSPARPRVALIGVSGYAKIYLQLLEENRDRVDLVAAVIINPQEEAAVVADFKSRGVAIYDDYEQMLRAQSGRIDLCLIPTGISWHARMAIAALKAGASVLVEKPLAGSLADVRAIREAERASGRFVAVGFQDVYVQEVSWLKNRILDGAIGRLESVQMIGLWARPANYFTRNNWAGRLHADGAAVLDSPLNNAFAHFVNLALYLSGPRPLATSTVTIEEAGLYRAHAIESFDTGVVRAVSAEGVRLWFGVSHSCRVNREPELYFEGSAGRIEWWHEQRCVIVPKSGAPSETIALPDTTATRRAMFGAVLARLRDPSTFIFDAEMSEGHTAFIDAVHRASPVQTVPGSLVSWENLQFTHWSGRIPVIRGIEEAFDRALAQRSTLAGAGFTLDHPVTS